MSGDYLYISRINHTCCCALLDIHSSAVQLSLAVDLG